MPTYEYECEACGHKFEKFQSMTAKPIRKCPVCGKSKVKRLIGTGGGLIFKGSGFYTTDYRSEAYKNAAKKDSGAAPAAADASKPTDPKTPAPAEAAKPAAADTPAAPKPAPAEPKAKSKPAKK